MLQEQRCEYLQSFNNTLISSVSALASKVLKTSNEKIIFFYYVFTSKVSSLQSVDNDTMSVTDGS